MATILMTIHRLIEIDEDDPDAFSLTVKETRRDLEKAGWSPVSFWLDKVELTETVDVPFE